MSENSLIVKKSDGSDLKFNFQFENWLPIKDVLKCEYQEMKSKSTHKLSMYVFLEKNDSLKLTNLTLNSLRLEDEGLWLILDDNYIFLSNISTPMKNEIKNGNVSFSFFNENKQLINSFCIQ